jgi:hypothetical protein
VSSASAADSYQRLAPVWIGPVTNRIVRGFGVASGTTDPANSSSSSTGADAGAGAASAASGGGATSNANAPWRQPNSSPKPPESS